MCKSEKNSLKKNKYQWKKKNKRLSHRSTHITCVHIQFQRKNRTSEGERAWVSGVHTIYDIYLIQYLWFLCDFVKRKKGKRKKNWPCMIKRKTRPHWWTLNVRFMLSFTHLVFKKWSEGKKCEISFFCRTKIKHCVYAKKTSELNQEIKNTWYTTYN